MLIIQEGVCWKLSPRSGSVQQSNEADNLSLWQVQLRPPPRHLGET